MILIVFLVNSCIFLDHLLNMFLLNNYNNFQLNHMKYLKQFLKNLLKMVLQYLILNKRQLFLYFECFLNYNEKLYLLKLLFHNNLIFLFLQVHYHLKQL